MPKATQQDFLTVGSLAVRLHVKEFHIRELVRNGSILPSRAGRLFIFAEEQIPSIRQALITRGFLKIGEA